MKKNLCPESESVSAQKKREIMEDLVKGHEAATELRLLLQNPFGTEPSLSSHHLIAKVLRSFTQALTIINSSPLAPASADGLAHRNLLFSGENGPSVPRSGNCPTSGDCSEKRSKKGGRGRYNRRKSLLTWTELSYTTDDNHAWRKYGQKKILNSEFPRGYFRCSHRYDKGCKATKQVQRDEQYPQMYQTTYIGSHTCNAISEIVTNSTDSSNWESYLLNSDHDSVYEPLIAHQP
ncbi:probable WRKY transcription factor 70 [Vigna umbellata]|uniref:probable WRKY transcription factor 70 n=1 Tax=Vigna umbellata TaxID=87088 RepID=UPI001F5F2B69|nr:probable WRKY transcription factor 70 [Vigna umbellata]